MKNGKRSKKRRNFSSFDLNEACKELGIRKLQPWRIPFKPLTPGKFFHERLRRLKVFDLSLSERSKELVIDALCEEALAHLKDVKIWKGALIQSDSLTGLVDYVAAPDRRYLETPLLCVVEAKKDDFEKGLAQCLVEMKACQWNNAQAGLHEDMFGIVTNADAWRFYKLPLRGDIGESQPHALGELENVLGLLHYVFTQCQRIIERHGVLR